MKLDIISYVFESPDRLYMIQLMQESSFITEGIARRLKNTDFFDCTRINFLCRDENVKNRYVLTGSIAEFDVLFDGEYFKMDGENKEKYLYELAYDSFEKLCGKKGWDYSLFRNAIDEIKAEGEEHIFETGLWCEVNGQRVELMGIQTMEKVDFIVDMPGKDRQILTTTKPNEIDYFAVLGKLYSDKTGKITLYDKAGKRVKKSVV